MDVQRSACFSDEEHEVRLPGFLEERCLTSYIGFESFLCAMMKFGSRLDGRGTDISGEEFTFTRLHAYRVHLVHLTGSGLGRWGISAFSFGVALGMTWKVDTPATKARVTWVGDCFQSGGGCILSATAAHRRAYTRAGGVPAMAAQQPQHGAGGLHHRGGGLPQRAARVQPRRGGVRAGEYIEQQGTEMPRRKAMAGEQVDTAQQLGVRVQDFVGDASRLRGA